MNNEKPIEEMNLTELAQEGRKHIGKNEPLSELLLAQRMMVSAGFECTKINVTFYEEMAKVISEGLLSNPHFCEQVKNMAGSSSADLPQEIERVSERFGQIQKEIMLRSLKKMTSI